MINKIKSHLKAIHEILKAHPDAASEGDEELMHGEGDAYEDDKGLASIDEDKGSLAEENAQTSDVDKGKREMNLEPEESDRMMSKKIKKRSKMGRSGMFA